MAPAYARLAASETPRARPSFWRWRGWCPGAFDRGQSRAGRRPGMAGGRPRASGRAGQGLAGPSVGHDRKSPDTARRTRESETAGHGGRTERWPRSKVPGHRPTNARERNGRTRPPDRAFAASEAPRARSDELDIASGRYDVRYVLTSATPRRAVGGGVFAWPRRTSSSGSSPSAWKRRASSARWRSERSEEHTSELQPHSFTS